MRLTKRGLRRHGIPSRMVRVLGRTFWVWLAAASLLAPPGPRSATAAETPPLTDVSPLAPDAVRKALIKGDFAAALDLIRKEIGKNPVSPDLGALRLLEARILRAQGDRAGSESAYRATTEDSVWAEPAVEELHEMMIERGEFDRSEELLTWAVGRVLEPTIGLLRGRSLFTQGRFHATSAAIDSTRGATSSEEFDAERRLLEANTRLVLGQVDSADSLFDGLLNESKDLRIKALAHYGKAQVARQRGARAIRVLEDERALTEWNAPWALLDAAIALRELGRTQESQQKLEALVRSAPYLDVPGELLMANLSDEGGKSEDAKEILAGLLRGSLSDPMAMANLGDIDLRERRSEEGLFLLRSAAEAVPDFAPFRQRLMRAWIDRGQKPDPGFEPILWDVNLVSAGEDLIEGNLPYFGVIADRDSMPPADPRRLVMALTFAVSGNAGTVIGWTEGATTATPGLCLARAFALHQVGRKDEALLVLEDLARDGKESWLSEELRLKLLYPDRRDQAEEIAKKILDGRPRDARFRMRLSRLREDAQDLEGAIALLREARNAGWLTVAEKRKLRDRLDDLEDLARSKGEGTEGAMKEGAPKGEPSPNEPREEAPREDEEKEEPGTSRS